MPANCKAGMYLTPSLDAIHVVPQKKQTNASAKMAFAFVPFLRMVKGLNTDNRFMESVVCVIVLCMSKRKFTTAVILAFLPAPILDQV